ncbi:MAG: tetratricopeptide repeat protein [Bacteroidales bacterium]|nr:tetratricopeptide repeat protein [Bacteroidales bacterium]
MTHRYNRFAALLIFVLLTSCPWTTGFGQSAFFNELYGRALRVDDTLPSAQSKRMSLLWMSYLADPSQASVLTDLANINLRENDNEKAYVLLSRAFETSHHDFHTGLLLMSLAGYIDEWDKVEEVKEVLLGLRPGDPTVLESLMRVYQMGGKDSLAIDVIRKLRERDKGNPAYTFQLASMLGDSERFGEAEKLLRGYLDEHPGDKMAYGMLFSLLSDSGQTDKAYELAKTLQEQSPDDPDFSRMLVGAFATKGDYAAVAKLLTKAGADRGASPDVVSDLIRVARRTAKDTKSLEVALLPILTGLKTGHPDEEAYQSLLMQHYISLNDTAGLRREVHALVASSAKARQAYDVLLDDYIKKAENDSVTYVVQRGLKAYPEDPVFLFYDIVGDLIKDPGGGEAVMKKIDHALSVIPADSRQALEIKVAKADLLEGEGKWKEARPLYEEAASRGHIGASNNLAYFLTKYGSPDDLAYAEKLASNVISAEPDNATYLDTYAWVLYKRGAYTLAKLYMKKAIDKSPSPDATYWAHYAEILTASGDYGEAKTAWRKALELGADSQVVETGIMKILDLEKNAQ